MTLRLPKVTLGGASGNLVAQATPTVLQCILNTPNWQIYCKTNCFFYVFEIVMGGGMATRSAYLELPCDFLIF